MKNVNNHGFVLVETIIVSVFVMGICAFLFSNFLPLIADYERIDAYDTVEGVYKTNEIRKMILRDAPVNNSIFSLDNGYVRYTNYEDSTSSSVVIKNSLCDKLNNPNYCNTLLGSKYLNVEEIIITTFKLGTIKGNVKNNKDFSRDLKEYISYLPRYDKYPSTYDNDYRIIVKYKNGEFSNMEVNYENK